MSRRVKIPEKRDISPMLRAFRRFLLGRDVNLNNRWANHVHPKDNPDVNIPEGTQHKLADNYYFSRDGRGEVKPNAVLVDNTTVADRVVYALEEGTAMEDDAKDTIAQAKDASTKSADGDKNMKTQKHQPGKRPGKYFNYST